MNYAPSKIAPSETSEIFTPTCQKNPFLLKINLMELSHDQNKALENLLSWYKTKNKKPFITLGGYAGTGKTTLISAFRRKLPKKLKIAFVSYTGKSTQVLKDILISSKSIFEGDFIGTIHSLIYSPIVDKHEVIIGWEKRNLIDFNLIIIDEASMVNRQIWDDLLSFNIPIIAIGDHGQLPPIEGEFNLMQNPELKLEKIHRQLADNPIIKLSMIVRQTGQIPMGKFSDNVFKISKQDELSQEKISELLSSYNKDTLVLCGYNSTRIKLNQFIRTSLGFESPLPASRDRVICLRNNHVNQIYNGMLGNIKSINSLDDEWYDADIEFDLSEQLFSGPIYKQQFNNPSGANFTKNRYRTIKGDLFDFGYALTVHKAQGSEADRVILFEEKFPKIDEETWRRWLYTAVTRSRQELFIIG